ncbi:hypothetical protein F5B20DRAFT_577728 [Whalleya microplaca]|nr:hypothetical protein F5B20DRAFT_577728 [Whalleya microplaca]
MQRVHTTLEPASFLAKDEDALVRFTLRHGGCETLVNRSNAKFEFDHNEASGPFAEWTVDMSGTEFAKLDATGVTDAYFDFCETNFVYD